MHTNTTTVRIPRARRTRTTTHHRPTTKGNLRRQHAAAQTATVRYFGEG
jgi:hypothetical protein